MTYLGHFEPSVTGALAVLWSRDRFEGECFAILDHVVPTRGLIRGLDHRP